MTIASRTPEGEPARCPVCGSEARIEFSDPAGDAPCPACGTLLWYVRAQGEVWLIDRQARQAAKFEAAIQAYRAGKLDSLDTVELVMELEEGF